jgi:hypothetical protein
MVVPAARDATLIEQADGLLANGAGPGLFVGRTSQSMGARRRALIAFDVAATLPAGAWIRRAELVLALTPSNVPIVDVTLHRVLSPWNEGPAYASGGGGAPAEIGDVTWIHRRYDSEAWALPGGDFAPESSAVVSVADPGSYVFGSTPQMVMDVQRWLDAPDSNHGWMLTGDEQTRTSAKQFSSREEPVEAMRPHLVVDYVTGCEEAGLARNAAGPCHAYCEALDCDGAEPRASVRACRRLARVFARRTRGRPLPCELPDTDGDGVIDLADSCPWTPNADQADLDANEIGDACQQ